VKKVHLAVIISFLILLTASAHAADELESLDSLTPSSDSEVALDMGSDEDVFNPYTFARTNAWSFLPIAALALVGLHLFRVPKVKSKRKIDQAKRFFRGISGEGTQSGILVTEKSEKK